MNIAPPCGISCCKGAFVLDKTYPVYLDKEQVGNINLRKIGLYYNVDCKCSLPGNRIFRLFAQCGDWKCKIGIPAPEGTCYALRTNVRFGEVPVDDLRFFVATDEVHSDQQRILICEDKPCFHMDQLEDMVYDNYNGKAYLMFTIDGNHSLLDT